MAERPNILFFHADNPGFGELRTLGDLLSGAGYGCAVYGKWHVGEGPRRWPTDKGFEEWYGPPRTYDESLWPYDP
jgi:arylsulfatase A-like enzyme